MWVWVIARLTLFLKSTVEDIGGRAALEDSPLDDGQDDAWENRNYVQFHAHREVLRRSIACLQCFLGELTLIVMESL